MGSRPNQRAIRRILIANRGEIAIRLLQSCHQLPNPLETFAIYTEADHTHIPLGRPHHAIKIPSPASYMDIEFLINLAKQHGIDSVHPGYGFLSESPEFSKRMWDEAGCMVVGPGWDVLEKTGDKLKAKVLAQASQVPVLKAMMKPTSRVEDVRAFAKEVGLPLMVKAVDGGGGRGIRLVQSDSELQNAVERCIAESPSRTVFAEQAAVEGFKHIEIQIIGDGKGGAQHLWERDCSVQRRFQKIVEIAPTPVANRTVIVKVIEAAVRMAKGIKYLGLGTFEFLVNVQKDEYYFLEINPRLQVEHTITESILGIDIVREQLLIAQGLEMHLNPKLRDTNDPSQPPRAVSIQFRLCAEDPLNNFSLSIGKVTNVQFPSGNGIRVDSHLSKGGSIGSDFDNLMAKIIVTASTWGECLLKSRCALADTTIEGVKTNLNLLCAIVHDAHFESGNSDTKWLEQNLARLTQVGERISQAYNRSMSQVVPDLARAEAQNSMSTTAGASSAPLRKGDAWSLTLAPSSSTTSTSVPPPAHHLRLDRITTNNFPTLLTAEITHTAPGHPPAQHTLTLQSTNASAASTSSTHRRGDPKNKNHVVLPMAGKLVEILVEEGDVVKENQVVAFVKQMKMELEVRSHRAGTVGWVIELEDDEDGEVEGEDVAEGTLICEFEDENGEVQGRSGRESKL